METLTPTQAALIPLPHRRELVVRAVGTEGQYVVKDPTSDSYYHLGAQEGFLLSRLDGVQSAEAIGAAFRQRFQEPFTEEDLTQFLDLARAQGFLQSEPGTAAATGPGSSVAQRASIPLWKRLSGNLLYWRISFYDPDRLLSWLAPKLRWLWTRAFVACSLVAFILAFFVLLANWQGFGPFIPRSLEALVAAWLVIGLATTLHEFAHGLTCKHHGGEVHEIGFLLMFFVPCFYCNVSDAWLLSEKSKRLWTSLAGTWCDLCLFALGVFLWRVTVPSTLPGTLASLLVAVCGLRVFFNAIPFMKLDGYYFLSDLLDIPNLRGRSRNALSEHVRWWFWGGRRPDPEPRRGCLLLFGLATWAFSLWFLSWMLLAMWRHMGQRWGLVGLALVAGLGWLTVPNFFVGFCKGEVMKMLLRRWTRTAVWLTVLGGITAAFVLVPMEERATGNFRVRPNSRAEVRAPVSGFLKTVHLQEGQLVEPYGVIVCLEVPDLESKIGQKEAEVRETAAKLRLLEAGPRPEEIKEQRLKVARAAQWRDLAQKDLKRRRQALAEEVTRLQEMIKQQTAELENAKENLVQARRLFESRALPLDQVRDGEKRQQVAQALVNQALAQKRERETVGTQEQEDELARRDKELSDARSQLTLLELGTRPEEIEAQRAHHNRLVEETKYLQQLKEKLAVVSPLAGTITTPYLREKIGQFFKEGDLICEVENLQCLEVEILLNEQELADVRPGQAVHLKARSLPFQTLGAEVDRIAPAAKAEKADPAAPGQPTFTIYCRLADYETPLRPGMTGYARIDCGQRTLGGVFFSRALRYVRTEFWW